MHHFPSCRGIRGRPGLLTRGNGVHHHGDPSAPHGKVGGGGDDPAAHRSGEEGPSDPPLSLGTASSGEDLGGSLLHTRLQQATRSTSMYASRRALAREEENEGKVGLYLGQLGSLPELCPYETIGPEGENEEDAQAVRQDRPAVLVIGVDHGLGWVELRSAGIILQGGGVRKGARAKGAPKNGGQGNPLPCTPLRQC